MKKIFIAFIAIGLTASCSKLLDRLTTFKFTRNAEFVLPETAVTGVPINLTSTDDVKTLFEKEFENNDSKVDKAEYIKITALRLLITDPAGANFNFLKSAEFSLSADGLPDATIASKGELKNDDKQELILDVSTEDVKQYLTRDKYKLKILAEVDELIQQDYTIKTITTFEVKAKRIK